MCDAHERCYKVGVIKGVVNEVFGIGEKRPPTESWAAEAGAILVVEDCEPLLFYLNSALLTLGYEDQHLAANLAEAEAVWALHRQEIRHIVLNYELPDGIALEFAGRVLRENPEVNVVITTGYELRMVKEASEHLQPLQFLQKPFRLGDLKDTLVSPALA
jgi:DNA-binding NtrC family response regulator